MRFTGLNKGFFILLLFIVSLAFFDIIKPYYSAILWAIVLGVIFYPVKVKMMSKLNLGNNISALLTLGLICLLVFVPLSLIVSSLIVELNSLYESLQQNSNQFPQVVASMINHLPGWGRNFLAEHDMNTAAKIQEHLSQFALKGGQYFANSAFIIGKGTFGFAVSFAIMLYLLFFLLKDGKSLVRLVLQPLPLSQRIKQHLLGKFAAVSRATVKGTVVVGVVQGILGAIAFIIVGIDGSVLWGALIAFMSLVPAVGSAVIWVPAAIYMFATDQLWQGIFIVGFFVIIVGLVDNILRPLLVGKDTRMPDYLILITTLGGLEVYGINGFVIGPLIAALFIASWNLLSEQSADTKIPGVGGDQKPL